MSNLALVLREQGKDEQAGEMHRGILGLHETVLREEKPLTLMSMNNLALALSCQGKYEEVEEMHREALGLSKTMLGKEHTLTLTSMNKALSKIQKQIDIYGQRSLYRTHCPIPCYPP